VVIANRLEATGVPGHIHISDRTLQLMLNHTYTILSGTEAAINDPYLKKRGIFTYLIPPTETSDQMSFSFSSEDESISRSISLKSVSLRSELNDSRISQELRNEFQTMPVGPVR